MEHLPTQQSLPSGIPPLRAPSFYLTERKPPGLGAILLAIAVTVGVLYPIVHYRGYNEARRAIFGGSGGTRSGGSAGKNGAGDDDDDPSQIDTIVLGDPADAPVPGRRGDHVSPVHPTILVRLPRFGDQVGLIPDTPAGRLLYGWLAAFNQASPSMLESALPNVAPEFAAAAQMDLRQETGGFNLLSAKEVQPGVLVFRLRDQTPSATEVLGTLQVRPNSSPAAILTFSLRAVPSTRDDSPGDDNKIDVTKKQ